MMGFPRSYAEIYGMLFISPKPLALDDLIELLGLSRGSASQGLRYLRNLGAIRMVYSMGDRRIHYEAVAELRNLVTRFLSERVVPHLDSGLERIEHVKQMVKQLPADKRAHLEARVTKLHSWEKKSRRFVGIVTKLLGS
jgi:DNA-binding transcriptional regulator GbsR (MarR family)